MRQGGWKTHRSIFSHSSVGVFFIGSFIQWSSAIFLAMHWLTVGWPSSLTNNGLAWKLTIIMHLNYSGYFWYTDEGVNSITVGYLRLWSLLYQYISGIHVEIRKLAYINILKCRFRHLSVCKCFSDKTASLKYHTQYLLFN